MATEIAANVRTHEGTDKGGRDTPDESAAGSAGAKLESEKGGADTLAAFRKLKGKRAPDQTEAIEEAVEKASVEADDDSDPDDPPVVAPKDDEEFAPDPTAKKFAALDRKKKKVAERERAVQVEQAKIETERAALAAERAEAAELRAELAKERQARERAHEEYLADPTKPYRDLGFTEDEIARVQLNGGKIPPELEHKVERFRLDRDWKVLEERAAREAEGIRQRAINVGKGSLATDLLPPHIEKTTYLKRYPIERVAEVVFQELDAQYKAQVKQEIPKQYIRVDSVEAVVLRAEAQLAEEARQLLGSDASRATPASIREPRKTKPQTLSGEHTERTKAGDADEAPDQSDRAAWASGALARLKRNRANSSSDSP